MNIFYNHLLATIMALALITPAMAEGDHHRACDSEATVDLGKMGEMSEKVLQQHIDKAKDQMKRVRHARGSHVSQKLELKRHLSDMQAAMQELHNQMYAAGCEEAMHGASVETRVDVMEKRMGMMQQMIEQMIEHMSEQAQ